MNTSGESSEQRNDGATGDSLAWIIGCLIMSLALGIGLAHLPARWKLLALLPILAGYLFGSFARLLASRCAIAPTGRPKLIFVATLSLACLLLFSWESFRLRREALKPSGVDLALVNQLILEQSKQKGLTPEATKRLLDATVQGDAASFSAFLNSRWPAPLDHWGPALWVLELLGGTFSTVIGFWYPRNSNC